MVAAIFTDPTNGLGITSSTPGCAVAISDRGSTVYAQGFGLADLATKTAITPTMVMDVGSIAKQFVAASILLLAQEHRLSLSDDIHTYVPELGAYGVPMPLRDLLWMESGLPDYLNAGLMATAGYTITDRVTTAQELAVIAKIGKLDFAPGSQFAYSNTNYFLLGLVVARVSGETLAAFEQRHIFGPLAMTGTALYDEAAPGVQPGARSYLFLPTLSFKPSIVPWDGEGPGGLHSDVLDLLHWAGNFTSGTVGGQALLSAQLKSGPGDASASTGLPTTYAAGLFISIDAGHPVIWHGGSWEGFRAVILIEPTTDRAVAITCNMDLAQVGFADAIRALDAWFGT